MRLIDADAFLEKMERTIRYFDVKFDVDEMPTIDAVPVVRCRECKHYTHKEQGYFCTAFVGDDFNVRFENDFCSYGERKEGADNGR